MSDVKEESYFRVSSCEEAALEATFKLVHQSKSLMSCNFCHCDQLVCVSVICEQDRM